MNISKPSAPESPAKEQPGEQSDVASMVNQLRMHAGATDTHIPRPMLARAADLLAKLGQEWIPVSGRLPVCPDDPVTAARVLVWTVRDGMGWVAVRFYRRPEWNKTHAEWWSGGDQVDGETITHWMPLPPPPPEVERLLNRESATEAVRDEEGWLIERFANGYHEWFAGWNEDSHGFIPKSPKWTRDAFQAIRFSRKEDGERVANYDANFMDTKVTEHGFLADELRAHETVMRLLFERFPDCQALGDLPGWVDELKDDLRLAQTELKGCYRIIDELKEELRLAREEQIALLRFIQKEHPVTPEMWKAMFNASTKEER